MAAEAAPVAVVESAAPAVVEAPAVAPTFAVPLDALDAQQSIPSPERTGPTREERWQASVAKLTGAETPALPGAAPVTAERATPTGWDAFTEPAAAPAVSPAHQRVKDRLAAAQQQQQNLSVQQQLEVERQRIATLTQGQQHAELEFKRLLDAGDVNGALKVRGIDRSFEDIQRQLLIAKGAMPAPNADPRVDALLQQQEQERQQRAQWEAQQRQQQQRQAQQAQWNADVEAVKGELSALPVPDADKFAALPGVSEAVLQTIVWGQQNGRDITAGQAAAGLRQQYIELRKQFLEWDPDGKTGSSPAPALGAIRTPPTSARPLAAPPTNLTRKQKWDWSVEQMRLQGKL